MSDLERRASQLFAAARAWNPVDRRLLDRAARRLEKKRRPMTPLALALAAASLALVLAPQEEPPVLEAPPPAIAPRKISSHKLRPALAKPERRARPRPAPIVAPPPIEEPRREPAESLAIAPPRRPKRYLPRAIADFQQVDWEWLEENRALPAYVRSIVTRRDRRALLAALDRLDVDRELLLLRGELRAGESRCTDAVSDFDAILGDVALRALHARASDDRDRCIR